MNLFRVKTGFLGSLSRNLIPSTEELFGAFSQSRVLKNIVTDVQQCFTNFRYYDFCMPSPPCAPSVTGVSLHAAVRSNRALTIVPMSLGGRSTVEDPVCESNSYLREQKNTKKNQNRQARGSILTSSVSI